MHLQIHIYSHVSPQIVAYYAQHPAFLHFTTDIRDLLVSIHKQSFIFHGHIIFH